MSKFAVKDIKGVIPAMFSTFDENEELDLERGRKYTNYLIDKGINGLYLTGSNGSCFLMTNEERKRYLEAVCDENNDRVPIIAHIGDISTKKSIDLAKHAKSLGVSAISSVPPFYYRFSEDDIFNYYKDICEAVDMPMIIYNISAGSLSNKFIQRLATIDNVVGMKYTVREHDNIAVLKATIKKDFTIFSGVDEMATSGLLSGADGIIGGYYNIIPELFLEIYDFAKANDCQSALALNTIACRLIKEFQKYDYNPLALMVLKKMGMDAGFARRPFRFVSEENLVSLKKFFNDLKAEYGKTHMNFLDNYEW